MGQTRTWTIRGIAALAMLAGCGRTSPDVAPVSGVVTLDGQPILGARLVFQPEATGSPSYGSTDQDGRYVLGYKRGQKGALIGWHTVRIESATELPGPNGKPLRPKPLPPRYNTQSELRKEVKPDAENQFDFELSSQPK